MAKSSPVYIFNMADQQTKLEKENDVNKDTLFFILIAILVSVLVRCCVSLNPYSGAGKPPMFGDYEAQRHWMEITINLPMKEWYVNSSSNDLMYWGLDYPPLTAYHSWLCGIIGKRLNPAWVELNTSRGYESQEHKRFMRYTVLAADILIYFPAVLSFCFIFYKVYPASSKLTLATSILLYPGLILIDHGHFQYNCISLGFALWGILCVVRGHDILGSIAFCLALNYKQMELYHASPFFSFLLGKALKEKTWLGSFYKVFLLGVTVVVTFIICWFPYLQNPSIAAQVLNRIFPFARGLYEDKVANVWCSISLIIKLKNLLSLESLISLSGLSTLSLLVPSNFMLVCRPSPKSFLFALVNSALVFFLFSFQVHEKSILLVTLPASLLLPVRPFETTWFLSIASFSMVPLIEKDGLLLAYIPTMMLFLLITFNFVVDLQTTKTISKLLLLASFTGCILLHVANHIIIPPRRYPDIHLVLISFYSCCHFLVFLLYGHYMQYKYYCSTEHSKKHS